MDKMSLNSLEESFQTAVTSMSDENIPVKDSRKTAIRSPKKEIALDSVAKSPGHHIDTLMDKYGFFLVTNRCRAVCITNAPRSVEEIERADNLKATLPEFVQKKILPKPNCDDETPGDLLVTLKDVKDANKKKKTKKSITKENTAPIQNERTEVKIQEHFSSDEELETRDPKEGEAKKPVSKPPKCEPQTEAESIVEIGSSDEEQEKKDVADGVAGPSSKLPGRQTENGMKRDGASPVGKEPDKVSSTSRHVQPVPSGNGRGPPYTCHEEKIILRYILDGNFEELVNGKNIWMKMEDDGVCPNRPWQSLRNRFKRHIQKNLSWPVYHLTADEISRIRNPQFGAYSRRTREVKMISKAKKSRRQQKASDGFYDMDMNWSDSENDS
ncbi:unnamed protein product [Ceutorhynchus assimilis]|uniref:Telomeric repeat-binding factor 2-interacting protein 1 n=1 Tax=Ceutorhynchus assimilis TaxID=467358 RepID=A0A9N9MGE9_9CUCU|nr:unnamed protein product [Ceutorhynchus assimilis]